MNKIPTPRTNSIVSNNVNPTRAEYDDLAAHARLLELELELANDEIHEYQTSISLSWNATVKAAELWRKSGPNRELKIPDKKDAILFLLEELEKANKDKI